MRRRRGRVRTLFGDAAILIAVVLVIVAALWAARALCRANPGCPWTIMF